MNTPLTLRVALVVIAVLIGIIVGLITSMLARTGGAKVSSAAMRGGIAFGGTIPLVLLMLSSIGLL